MAWGGGSANAAGACEAVRDLRATGQHQGGPRLECHDLGVDVLATPRTSRSAAISGVAAGNQRSRDRVHGELHHATE